MVAAAGNRGSVAVRLRIGVYDEDDQIRGRRWRGGQTGAGRRRGARMDAAGVRRASHRGGRGGISGRGGHADGAVLVDYLRWDGPPSVVLRRPEGGGDFWRRAWVNGADLFTAGSGRSLRISQGRGEGLVAHGTRQWTDYEVNAGIVVHLCVYGGIALRVQGLRRYYGIRLTRDGKLQIVRVRDDVTCVLAETGFPLEFERMLAVTARVRGTAITATVDGVSIGAVDGGAHAFGDGGIGLFVKEGALSADAVRVTG